MLWPHPPCTRVQRREDRLAALADHIRRECGVAVHTVALDVRDLEAVASLPEQLPAEFQASKGFWAGPGVVVVLPPLLLLPAWQCSGLVGTCRANCRVRRVGHRASRACQIARCRSQLPRLALPQEVDVLVPNAGLALGVAPIHELDFEDARAMIDTNGEPPAAALPCSSCRWLQGLHVHMRQATALGGRLGRHLHTVVCATQAALPHRCAASLCLQSPR